MHASIRWALAAIVLSACNQHPNADAAGADTSGTPAVSQEAHGGDMFYASDTLPAASSPGMLIGLTLHATGDAEMSTDYLNYFPEIIAAGPWLQHGDTISMVLKTMDVAQTNPDTMVFLRRQHELHYLGKGYGTLGLVLHEQRKPDAQPRVLVMWVHPQKTSCTDNKGQPRECLQVTFSKVPPDAQTHWQPLPEEIKKFTFVPGHLQQIKVLRTPRHSQLADSHDYSYELLAVLSNH